METTDMKERIEKARHEVIVMFHDSILADNKDTPLSRVLGQVIDLLRDANKMTDHPLLDRMDCIMIRSGIHAVLRPTFLTECGAVPEPEERITPRKTLPDCPECLAILEARADARLKAKEK